MCNNVLTPIHNQEGDYTFNFTYLYPQPANATELDETVGFVVQGAELLTHDATNEHHGNSFTNAAYCLWDRGTVNAQIEKYKNVVHGAQNGTGGRGGAVMCIMRAVANMNQHGKPQAGLQLNKLAEHVFERSEREKAMQAIREERR